MQEHSHQSATSTDSTIESGGSIDIDCGTCEVRGLACADCVVTVLLGATPDALDAEDRRALGVLADSGLVPPLRLVPRHSSTDTGANRQDRRQAG